jgi:NAD-dependent SIR2 family protein deacetylase
MSDSKNNSENNSDKVQCINCKRYVSKDDIAILMNGTDPVCTECEAYLEDMIMEQQILEEQERYVEITKEMASDAGMPEIEGQRMRW